MPEEKRLSDLTLGKRFPHRLLNFFPRSWKRHYLIEKSGGATEPEALDFSAHFHKARRIVLAWPERREEILAAFPAARTLFETVPEGTEWVHLCEAQTTGLVQDLFPGAVVEWKNSEIAWHDPATENLIRQLTAVAADTIVMLAQTRYPLVVQAIVRATHAPVRIGWEGPVGAPFANIRVQPDPATPLAARGFQALEFWRYAGFSLGEEWVRIQSDAASRLASAGEWAHKRAEPGNTWLYIHDVTKSAKKKGALAGPALDDALFSYLDSKVGGRDLPGYVLGAVLWNPGNLDVPRSGAWLDAPIFSESDLPALLSVLEGARGVIGFNGFGLQFAGLVDVRCVALLRPDEALYDASPINKTFEVEWV